MRTNLPVGCTPETYDLYTTVGVDVYDRMLMDRVTDEFRRLGRPAARIVDACTGTGQLLLRVASIPELAGASFVAFDLFENMVEVARRHVAEAGQRDRIRVDVADIHALPYEDGFADMIFARSVVHHWADPVQAFRELDRILAPGGVAIIHEPRRDPAPEAHAAAEEERRRVGVRPVILEEKYTAEEVRTQLRAASVRKFDVYAEEEGPGAIGFEVRIEKKRPVGNA
jgi:ubiquinone/menaquinone biosynthesis C-methylase UbiE